MEGALADAISHRTRDAEPNGLKSMSGCVVAQSAVSGTEEAPNDYPSFVKVHYI